jgi:hypothetical protein
MSTQVGRDDVVAVGEPLGEVPEASAVGRDAVETDKGCRLRVTPLVQVQRQSASSPLPDGR